MSVPCGAYGCVVCGPRVVLALRAAARTRTGRWIDEGWRGAVVTTDDESVVKALRRWAAPIEVQDEGHEEPRKMDHPDRKYFGVAQHPDRPPVYLVLWNEMAGGNTPPRSVLADADVVDLSRETLADAADRVVAGVDLAGWNHVRKTARKQILRGQREVMGAISLLRDAVLGRARALPKSSDGDQKKVEEGIDLGSRSIEQVMEEAERRTGCKTRVDRVAADVRSRRRVLVWSFIGPGAENHNPDEVIRQMHADGFFKSPRRGRPALVVMDVEDDGFSTLDA